MTTTPFERAVVISTLTGAARDVVLEAMSDLAPPIILAWETDSPDKSLGDLTMLLSTSQRVLVDVRRPHQKNIRDIATRARKKGYFPYVLEEEWQDAAPKIDMPFRFIPIPVDRRGDRGPFDIIGDIHGCALEFADLLDRLGYMEEDWNNGEGMHRSIRRHPRGRRTILLGDLVDRGPMNLETMRMARALEELGGLRVLGNHDAKIGKWLMGRDVRVGPHQESTIREFDSIGAEERAEWGAWMLDAEGHYLLDDGRLAVAHAGIDEENQGRVTGGAMSFALYGKPDPENRLDEEGYPIAEDWAATYGGDATVVHGHIVHDAPREMNNVIAIDTGCVFGGDLTALRWPERTYERVPARQEWWKRR